MGRWDGCGDYLGGDTTSGGVGEGACGVEAVHGGRLVEVDDGVSRVGRIEFGRGVFLVEAIRGVVVGMVSLFRVVVVIRRVGGGGVLVLLLVLVLVRVRLALGVVVDICGGRILMAVLVRLGVVVVRLVCVHELVLRIVLLVLLVVLLLLLLVPVLLVRMCVVVWLSHVDRVRRED
jgi:hypothetical protein